ncbi:MAG TPA: ABC transporter ATP-binding protein [Devosia sp.]|nr:ABC transporter ATP-binding protein [Devosia sp.]
MALVEIDDLHVSFSQHEGLVQAVRGVSFELQAGESLGIVGESGSGKSVTCSALLRLLRVPPARITARRMRLDGHDILAAGNREMSALRGRVAAMVFQDPMTSLDPVFTVGHQISETIMAHRKVSKAEALEQAIALLRRVEIKNAEAVVRYYPHQLSGGMLQRVMIAIALSCEPAVLIADEPTTALDVTIQAQILQLIKDIQAETGMGLIMITHDLGVIAETVDRVLVMYGGKVMETGPVGDIFAHPLHPYTKALLNSIPGQKPGKQRLVEIPGASPNPARPPNGCPFHPRCPMAIVTCHQATPPLETKRPGRQAACIRVEAEMALA